MAVQFFRIKPYSLLQGNRDHIACRSDFTDRFQFRRPMHNTLRKQEPCGKIGVSARGAHGHGDAFNGTVACTAIREPYFQRFFYSEQVLRGNGMVAAAFADFPFPDRLVF